MKHLLLSLFLLNLLTFNLNAADNYPVGARSAALGGASVTFSDLWSAFNNQAGLAQLKSVQAGAYYENEFLLSDLSLRSFAFALPANNAGVFALSATEFGGDLYSETKAGLAYSKQLGEKFSAGVQLDYLSTHIAPDDAGYVYGTSNSVAVEGGFMAEPLTNLTIGMQLFNPTKAKLAMYDNEYIPTIMRLGASYKFSDKVLVCSEIEDDVDGKDIVKAGLEYHIVDQIYIRGGISGNPALTSFGFGFKIKRLQVDVASSYHQALGFTPQLSLLYDFKKQ